MFNSLVPGRCGNDYEIMIPQVIIQNTKLLVASLMSPWLLWWPPTGSSMFMVVVMLLKYSVLHCLYSVGNKITTTTTTRHSLWYCSQVTQMNTTKLYKWELNIGFGNGLVPSGSKLLPEPMLTQISIARWRHKAITHLPLDKMAYILQTTFANAFSWMRMYWFRLKFHWSLCNCPISNIPALAQIMAWRRLGDKPLSEPMLTRITDAYMLH